VTARRYASPAAFKHALEERLRRHAEEIDDDFGRMRQRCVVERFLARLAVQFGDRVVVKGGIALQLRIEGARMTRDLDLRMVGDAGNLLEDLRRAGQLMVDVDFLSFTVEHHPKRPTIEGEGVPYGGQRFRVAAMLAGKIYGAPFGVDVGFGSVMARPADVLSGTELFAFAGLPPVSVRVYAREVHVAEKLHALTLPRDRENSRIKDMPDIALLGMTGPFESAALRDAIRATFVQRGTRDVPSFIEDPPVSWAPAYATLVEENTLRWRTLDELAIAVRAFLDPVLHGEDGIWDPTSGSGRRGA
jgi:hypothetical protein